MSKKKEDSKYSIGATFHKKKDYKKFKKYILIISCLFLFSIIFCLLNLTNENIYKNIFYQSVLLSGIKPNDAVDMINEQISNKKSNNIILKYKDYISTIDFDSISYSPNVNLLVSKAYSVGRSSNIIVNNYEILSTFFIKRHYNLEYTINENSLKNQLLEICNNIPGKLEQCSYEIDGSNLILSKGKIGIIVDIDKLISLIKEKINDISVEKIEINIPVEEKNPDLINIEKIANDIKKVPVNASVDKSNNKITIDQDGVELGVSIDDAKNILAEEKDEYTIPLKILKPEITVADLGEDAFPNLLASYSTIYDPSNINRNNNLILASEKLNNTIIDSNETFSYNTVIGKRTIDAGFKIAKAYSGNNVVLDVGGGICQLSTTLYNACLLENLEIVERHNHIFAPTYVPEGQDATVSYGTQDFRIKNNRTYPIKIKSEAKDGVVKVEIYGITEENDYQVEIKSKITSIIPFSTTYQEDNSLPLGEEETIISGENGCTTETTKILKRKGVIVSKDVISEDKYIPLNTLINRNT